MRSPLLILLTAVALDGAGFVLTSFTAGGTAALSGDAGIDGKTTTRSFFTPT